jgi:hypothetical protein
VVHLTNTTGLAIPIILTTIRLTRRHRLQAISTWDLVLRMHERAGSPAYFLSCFLTPYFIVATY